MKQQLKNLVTVCALLTVISLETQAAPKTLSIAPVAGGNSFNFDGSGMESRGGSIFGANVLIPIGTSDLSFETGLNYLETGAKTDMIFASAEVSLGYLAIPLLANWEFYRTSGGTEWFLKGGAYVSHLMSAKQKAQILGASQETDIKDQMSGTDVLATAGVGARWTVFDKLFVSLDLNYAKGLMNTMKDVDGKSSGWILASSLIIPL